MNPPAIEMKRIHEIRVVQYKAWGFTWMTLTSKLYKRDPKRYPTTTPRITALKASKLKAIKAMAIPKIIQTPKLTLANKEIKENKIRPRIAQLIRMELVFQL